MWDCPLWYFSTPFGAGKEYLALPQCANQKTAALHIILRQQQNHESGFGLGSLAPHRRRNWGSGFCNTGSFESKILHEYDNKPHLIFSSLWYDDLCVHSCNFTFLALFTMRLNSQPMSQKRSQCQKAKDHFCPFCPQTLAFHVTCNAFGGPQFLHYHPQN